MYNPMNIILNKDECEASLILKDQVMKDLNVITNEKWYISYNDIYYTKENIVRRLKIGCGKDINKDTWLTWANKIKQMKYNDKFIVEFDELEQRISDKRLGMLMMTDPNRWLSINYEEYLKSNDTFIVRIRWKH
jgi:hypothetical protein